MKKYLLAIICITVLVSGCATLKTIYEKGKEHCDIDYITKKITCKASW